MIRLMTNVMPSCKDTAELVSEGMDHKVPLRKRIAIRLHISMCRLCRRYARQLQLLRKGAQRYADPEENQIESSLSPETKQRLKERLESGK